MAWQNLDLKCAQTAEKISAQYADAKELKAASMRAMTVLSQNGPYALCRFLMWRNGDPEKAILTHAENLVREVFQRELSGQRGGLIEGVKHLSSDLDRLFLLRKLLGQVLVYAQYQGGKG